MRFERVEGVPKIMMSHVCLPSSPLGLTWGGAMTWGATVRGTYPMPEAATHTRYVLYVGPWGRAALCVRYVPNAGGWYA